MIHGAGAAHNAVGSAANQHWWPHQLNLRIRHQHAPDSDPMGDDFDDTERMFGGRDRSAGSISPEVGRISVERRGSTRSLRS